MKDKHNVILILVYRVNSIPYFGGSSNSRVKLFHLFFFRRPVFSALYHHEDPSKSLQGFTLCFQFLFLFILLFTGVLHGDSTWWFIKDLISSWSVHQDSFLRNSSFLHIVIRSAFFLSYYWRWYYAILDNLSSCFMIHLL